MSYLSYAVSAWLFVTGLYGIITSRNLIHMITCLWVTQTASYVLLLSIGYRSGATAPIVEDIPVGTPAVDPVIQSLILIGVVVGVIVSALLLGLAVLAHKRFGTLHPAGLRRLRG